MRALSKLRVDAHRVGPVSLYVHNVAVVLPLNIFSNFKHDAVVILCAVIVPAAAAGKLAMKEGHAFDLVVRGEVANAQPW